jgi:hypothetical protein
MRGHFKVESDAGEAHHDALVMLLRGGQLILRLLVSVKMDPGIHRK